MDETGNWCQIESDPAVFTELIQRFGVRGLQFDEIWSLDEESWKDLGEIRGLIFLFKWEKTDEPMGVPLTQAEAQVRNVFFAKQVIQNACGSLALVNLILNTSSEDVEIGKTLKDMKEFCVGFDPTMTGLTLTNCEEIRKIHNSFARQTVFEFEEKLFGKKEDVYHFVTYLPINGKVYELDGLRESPIDLGVCSSKEKWMETVVPILKERMRKYQNNEIHFSLMAAVPDKIMICEKKMADLQKKIADPKTTAQEKTRFSNDLKSLKLAKSDEERRRAKFSLENERRKHNYIPLLLNMLRMLGTQTDLQPIYEKAKERAVQREKRKQRVETVTSPSTEQVVKKAKKDEI
ncbi:unnamed protein product [Cyprideis torosa]|uniref:Ubiquitin carboxyl-terminal hydrolase n=1 Tax=Cyprideis torosa TaxID=163714 RepID=A0A7R8W5K4_9CRUS|nr:unnamed protein product [Cyprideis torosa]CAG0879970.1 unnamed protein product [Cyprideis torosa]